MNKQLQIGIGVVLVIALLVGGYFFIASRSAKQSEKVEVPKDTVQQLTPKEIGLTIEASANGKQIKFLLAKATGIVSVEYELTYEADSTIQEQADGAEPRVQRGVTGEEELSNDSSYESPWIDLGSCSSGVCKYDNGVESVDLTLKIVKEDGAIYAVQDSLTIE